MFRHKPGTHIFTWQNGDSIMGSLNESSVLTLNSFSASRKTSWWSQTRCLGCIFDLFRHHYHMVSDSVIYIARSEKSRPILKRKINGFLSIFTTRMESIDASIVCFDLQKWLMNVVEVFWLLKDFDDIMWSKLNWIEFLTENLNCLGAIFSKISFWAMGATPTCSRFVSKGSTFSHVLHLNSFLKWPCLENIG